LERFEELSAASRATEADLEIDGLTRQPRPYQAAGALFAAKARRCFIADDTGLGKTGQAIMALEIDGAYPAVVVCPPKLVVNWGVEYQKWLPSKKVAVVKDRKGWPDEPYDVVVVGWSNVTHWKERISHHRGYVLDESHYAKTPTSARTKAIRKAVETAPEAMVLCLTATPISNRPAEYVPQLAILGALDTFGGDMGFYRRYCQAKRDRFGQWDFSGAANTDELNDKLRGEGLYLRRVKSEVLGELPPIIYDPVTIEGAPALMKEYEKAKRDIIAYVQEQARLLAEELGHNPDGAALRAKMRAQKAEFVVRFSALRKIAARAKLPFAYEWIDAQVEEGRQVVVAAHHREIVDELAAKYGGVKIQGGQSVADVEEAKRKFQAGQAPVIVVSIMAGREGHTLTAAQNILSVELPWTWADYYQMVSRLHRMGQQGVVQATNLLIEGTVDERVWETLERKRDITSSAVDGADIAVDLAMEWL
jgi:SNF2 family DNA or RNA helicase